ncbi:hypothetical protein PGH07_00380 [Sulfurovum sp. zt1-1]|uniref:Uncharacterized protein n=1 Tax=Sulfurovum zhangzhouensis TaxID=3019067 RepID=A0ABT7QV17_9BACT|nr:hypothetical protein [Sulfurovum zhangzhouensis]MDM5270628.1 hypothetical protein [Sulfurovum zhangzhouensis]
MSNSLDRLKALSNKLEEKNREKNTAVDVKHDTVETSKKATEKKDTATPVQTIANDSVREENIIRLKALYNMLGIFEKSPDFDKIFVYKAMNLSGIGLKEEDFGEVREGKYIQIIAITYEPDKNGKKKAKNISLGYFGKAEALEADRKNNIIEFVLRWRYEKAFQNVEHYKYLIAKVKSSDTLF